MSAPDSRRIEDLFEQLSYAHRNLTVHLDLKPSNMLVNAEGDVKLVDFGVARHLSADGAADKTSTLNRWLSLKYAAPEQIRGETVDVRPTSTPWASSSTSCSSGCGPPI